MDRLDVRTVAAGRWRGILQGLGMDERALSGKHGPCPMCGGKDRFRFDDKEGRGTFFCSGCGAGDGVQLAMRLTGASFRETAQQIERLAGVVQPVGSSPERTDEAKIRALRRVWEGSAPMQRGDEAYRYLAGRGLTLSTLPRGLRTHPCLPYREEGAIVGSFQAMLALVTSSSGKAVSIHRTYLQNASKAPVERPKKLMAGMPISGAAIRLAPVSTILGVSEGIETALAAAELFKMPVWACISAQGVEAFEPPEGVREVVIFGDHDTNYAGQSAAYRAAHRLKLKGYAVDVAIPMTPGDWLNELAYRASLEPPSPPITPTTNAGATWEAPQ